MPKSVSPRAAALALLSAASGLAFAAGAPARADTTATGVTAPGWAWGRFRYPEQFERNGEDHLVYDLIAEQGFRFKPDNFPLQPELFVRLDLKRDNQYLDYDNRAKPAAGVRVWLEPIEGLKAYAGARYDHEYRWQSGAAGGGVTLFAGWQIWWKPQESQGLARRLAFSSWGEIRSPYSHLGPETENIVSEGGAQGDLSLYHLTSSLELVQRAGVEFSIDSEDRGYRNWLKPSLGLVLQYRADEDTKFELGARAAAEWRFREDQIEDGYSVFATFSRSWQLRAPF